MGLGADEKKWLFTLFSATFVSLLFILSSISLYSFNFHNPFTSPVRRGTYRPPSFAYYISGGHEDGNRIFRLLLAVYHPKNRYLLHIGTSGTEIERRKLAAMIMSIPAIRAFENVDVVGQPDPGTYMGSTNIAAVLRAAAVLLKLDSGWDWFITLSASDYPLITQDGNAISAICEIKLLC